MPATIFEEVRFVVYVVNMWRTKLPHIVIIPPHCLLVDEPCSKVVATEIYDCLEGVYLVLITKAKNQVGG